MSEWHMMGGTQCSMAAWGAGGAKYTQPWPARPVPRGSQGLWAQAGLGQWVEGRPSPTLGLPEPSMPSRLSQPSSPSPSSSPGPPHPRVCSGHSHSSWKIPPTFRPLGCGTCCSLHPEPPSLLSSSATLILPRSQLTHHTFKEAPPTALTPLCRLLETRCLAPGAGGGPGALSFEGVSVEYEVQPDSPVFPSSSCTSWKKTTELDTATRPTPTNLLPVCLLFAF